MPSPGPWRRARLYGVVLGNGSLARVTSGFRSVLQQYRWLVGEVPLDRMRDDEAYLGADAPIGILTGRLSSLEQLKTYGIHRERWAMVAPNCDRIPEALVGALRAYTTYVLTPSKWGADVLRGQLGSFPVRVVPHGIEGFAPQPEALAFAREGYRIGGFGVLHMTSTERQRKGTYELLEAWGKFCVAHPDACLTIVVEPEGLERIAARGRELRFKKDQLFVIGPGNAPAAQLSEIYGKFHVVCQPSRGEGFGLVPLEALAAGGVVVATACTGHSEYMPATTHRTACPGLIVVPHGPPGPVDEHPAGQAPTVAPDAIAAALEEAYRAWPELSAESEAAAPAVAMRWSWQNTTGRALQEFG